MKYIKHIIKLDEIVNLKQTHTKVPGFDTENLIAQKRNAEGGANTGAFAKGEQDPNDPHMFDKTNHLPGNLNLDPYYLYIKASAKYAKSNPFIPRVYNINSEVAPDNSKRPTFKIEKLMAANQLSTEALVGIGHILSSNLGDEMEHIANNSPKGFLAKPVMSLLVAHLAKYLYNIIDGKITPENPQLKQATDIIKRVLHSSNNFKIDMHGANFMFRGTPKGPQLVITDPLAIKSKRD